MESEQKSDTALVRFLHEEFSNRHEELFLVGGAVRDALLGKYTSDLDLATSALPETTLRILESSQLGTPHRMGEKFGTIGFTAESRHVEITTYRAEQYRERSRKPDVRFGTSLVEDLRRRDFTINAIAVDPVSGDTIDPFDGRKDLHERRLRTVGSPQERFSEDPLRLLRAVRFAAQLHFDVDPGTWDAMISEAASLSLISRERVRDEFEKILVGPDPTRGMELLRDSGLLDASIPALVTLTTMPDHGPNHPLSLWDHTMRVVSAVPPAPVVRWAALLHDVAKPATRTHEPDGRIRFFHHEEIGAQIAHEVLEGLRYSKAFVSEVATLVEVHMHLHAYSDEWSDGAVRRLATRLGPLFAPAISLVRADAAGHSLLEPAYNAPKFDALEKRIAQVSADSPSEMRSPLSGTDLMQRYGRPPGPWIRAVKAHLEEEMLEGHLAPHDVPGAWAMADVMMEEPLDH